MNGGNSLSLRKLRRVGHIRNSSEGVLIVPFEIQGICPLTLAPFKRQAEDANQILRDNVRAHMDVWGSTAAQIAEAIQVDAIAFEEFMRGERDAPLDWVTRIAAYSQLEPSQVLAWQMKSQATENVLRHLEIVCTKAELEKLLEGVFCAKQAGTLDAAIESTSRMNDAALGLRGVDPEKVRAVARRLVGAA